MQASAADYSYASRWDASEDPGRRPRPDTAANVSVIVPAMNEAANLPHVLGRIATDYEVIVVDGHSTDGTADVARRHRPDATVVSQKDRGKGDALKCGFEAASGDIYVMLDGDGSARPEEIPAFVNTLQEGADLAKGSRFLPGGGSADITFLRRAGNAALREIVNQLFGTRYTDLCYGYNAFWSGCLPRLALDCAGFEVETLINIRAAKAGMQVTEVPSFEDSRIHGASNLRTFRDGWRVLRTIRSEYDSRLRSARAGGRRNRNARRKALRGPEY